MQNFTTNSIGYYREHNTSDWLGKERNLNIFWAPILNQTGSGVLGAIGVICPVDKIMSCDSDLNLNTSLEDFEALLDSDFKLIEDYTTRDDVELELNYLETHIKQILEKCSREGAT